MGAIPDGQSTVVIDRRERVADPNQANPTLTAISQLLTFAIAVTAVCVLAISHTLDRNTVGPLAGVIIAHAGIIGYNGATKGSKS